MTSGVCTVAVDVGNSALKLCVRKQESKRGQEDIVDKISGAPDQSSDQTLNQTLIEHSIRIDESGWHDAAISWVREHVRCGKLHWRIASVHRDAAERLVCAISAEDSLASVRQITAVDIPMKVNVDEPDRVGIDRLLGAYAAWNRYKQAVVVVDAGSAITVDWICDEGCFQGGAILPGLVLQTHALATGTDALPDVSWQSDHPEVGTNPVSLPRQIPAKNTSDAIRLGVLTSASATIDRLAQSYHCSHAGVNADRSSLEEPRLVMTGGDAMTISPSLRSSHDLISNLVCRGLLDLPTLAT